MKGGKYERGLGWRGTERVQDVNGVGSKREKVKANLTSVFMCELAQAFSDHMQLQRKEDSFDSIITGLETYRKQIPADFNSGHSMSRQSVGCSASSDPSPSSSLRRTRQDGSSL